MTYTRAWMSSKFGQILSGTTELAALEHLKIDVAAFSHFTVVVIPGRLRSGERLQDQWSSVFFFGIIELYTCFGHEPLHKLCLLFFFSV